MTSEEYCLRYGVGDLPDTAEVVRDVEELRRLTGYEVEELDGWIDFEGEVHQEEDGVELQLDGVGILLAYPFTLDDLMALALELEQEAEKTCPTCGAALVPVAYGYPGPELVRAEQRGEVVLGGCMLPEDGVRERAYPWPECRGGW